MSRANDFGRAYEFAWITTLEKYLQKYQPVKIIDNSSYHANRKAWSEIPLESRSIYITSVESAIEILLDCEPTMTTGTSTVYLECMKDEAGIEGDVRDIRISKDNYTWEIGLSLKHNHEAVKHSRLSHKLDFGKVWYDMPCSKSYWNKVNPIFEYLKVQKSHGTKWHEMADKDLQVYRPLLEAFAEEITRANMISEDMPRRMIEYLLGVKDYYKIVSHDSKKETVVYTFNMNNTLNMKNNSYITNYSIPLVELPTTIENICFKTGSNNTVEVHMNNDWHLSFRIHNASTKVEPSLKFDIQLIKQPSSIMKYTFPWY